MLHVKIDKKCTVNLAIMWKMVIISRIDDKKQE